ncbi:hypothetical protein [Solidesulfovibrio fructosivorans]|uniref:hypothetical protein n=1 Tax=Solidesulfovibrio fructosivorans TaxID=878 RepID=UPI0011806300|nr:hypothetical protein [Solidesulfovibrio fructosivorans]
MKAIEISARNGGRQLSNCPPPQGGGKRNKEAYDGGSKTRTFWSSAFGGGNERFKRWGQTDDAGATRRIGIHPPLSPYWQQMDNDDINPKPVVW